MGLVGHWKFARLLNVGCPWILLLPLHSTAYVGILGNVARQEDRLKGDLDLSVWYVLVRLSLYLSLYGLWRYKSVIALSAVAFSLLFVWIIGLEIHYSLFRLYSRHPFLVALVWFFPGVVLWQALVAEKRLEESI